MTSPLPSYVEAAAMVARAAFARRSAAATPRRTELLPLGSALGRVLAAPVVADRDMPAFPRSTRDGFACRAAESSSWLRVAGSTRAGQSSGDPLPPACAWEIMTGAAVPEGADAVAMLEHVEHEGASIRLGAGRTLTAGENVVPTGAEARHKEELFGAGVRLSAAHIAAAAMCGYASLPVVAKPRVAILTTGDELVAVDSAPGPAQIRNSNAPMLAALVAQAGGDPWILPACADRADDLEAALAEASRADMLLISGGVSAGSYDLVEPALARLGAQFHFTGVRIQPGKPLVFGEFPDATPFFGLPGNPISSAATFLLFASPVLGSLAGDAEPGPRFLSARLAREVMGKPTLTRFVPSACRWPQAPGSLAEVTPVGWQGSGDLAAFARANCFLVVPEGESLPAGSTVTILPF